MASALTARRDPGHGRERILQDADPPGELAETLLDDGYRLAADLHVIAGTQNRFGENIVARFGPIEQEIDRVGGRGDFLDETAAGAHE